MPSLFDPEHDDVALLARLHAASFDDAWKEAAVRELFAGPGVFAIWERDGFILARAAGGEAEILTLAVVPAARQRGIGRALVRRAAIHAQNLGAASLFLEVAIDNVAASRLYAGLGFKQVGLRKGYYAGRDAALLKANLPLSNSSEFA